MDKVFIIADTNFFDQGSPESIASLCELIRKHKPDNVCLIGDVPVGLHLNRINIHDLPASDTGD